MRSELVTLAVAVIASATIIEALIQVIENFMHQLSLNERI
jgi:hypothetical protein